MTQSTTVLASVSVATINVFDTVANTANAITKVINGITTTADAFERMMKDMDYAHEKRSVVYRATYLEQMLEDKATEITNRQVQTLTEMGDKPDFKKIYSANLAKLEALFPKEEAK